MLTQTVQHTPHYANRAGEDDFDWDDSDQDDDGTNDEAIANRKKLKLLKKKERKAALKARARKEAEDALAKAANARYLRAFFTHIVFSCLPRLPLHCAVALAAPSDRLSLWLSF
jgi:hypothetical protein